MTAKPIPNINKKRTGTEYEYYLSFLRIFSMKGRFHLLFVAVFHLNNKFIFLDEESICIYFKTKSEMNSNCTTSG